MSDYTNFEVGQKFPLPIATQADGAMFQVDANGAMFILQLSRTDVIAREAFRTGKMEFAFYEQDGLLFLLYQIDGIFKEGWGDAPLSLHTLKPELLPTEKSLQDKTLHLYLVDTTLQILLAQRDIELNSKCQAIIQKHAAAQKKKPFSDEGFRKKVQSIWQKMTPAMMRQKASAVQSVPLAIPKAPSQIAQTNAVSSKKLH
ncbi:hypothetical protein [uncultured Mitsuokella sp.]|uniref:hypothetical protein n=1 Tax=uncultured Mitsuokella sp. TaxID=453120 RepID=UPI0025EC1898|nr:hypothetical protein [uncultured Mitsuokella sp.]